MDEEHESGPPEPRAPWERSIADRSSRSRSRRDSGAHRSESEEQRPESGRRRAADADDPEQLTVAELLNKVRRGDDPPPEPPESETSLLPPIEPSIEPPLPPSGIDRARPAQPPLPAPPPPAVPGPPRPSAPAEPPRRVPPPGPVPGRPRPPEPPAARPAPPPKPVQPPAPPPPPVRAPAPPPAAAPAPPPSRPPAIDDSPTQKIEAVGPPADDEAASIDPELPAVDHDDIDDSEQEDGARSVGPRTVGNARVGRLALSKKRKRRKLRVAARAVVALGSVLALVGTGAVWGYVRSTEAGFSQIAALDTESDDIVDPGGQTGDETYLIIGTDTRAGASGAIGAGTELDAEGARADTVILVNIPADRSRVVAVSFPRDLDVERPVCRGWDSATGEYSSELYPAADGDKLNATYALGGPRCLVKVIQKMSGLKIGHFVGIDFAGFEAMVDEIGGVDVCTTMPLIDGELGPLIETPGTHTLDGRRALDYVRARKIDAEGNSDYGRISRQQKFLSSLLRETLSNRVLLDPGKLNGFINAFTRATFVENVNTESLVNLARSMQNMEAGAVSFLTVPTAGTNDWGNEIPRLDDIKAIFTAIIDDLPLPGEQRDDEASEAESPPPPVETAPAELAVDPSLVSVQVSNASGVSGQAQATADTVATYGFPVYSVGNYASGTSKQTVIRFGPGEETAAATVASAFPGAVLQEAPPSAQLGSIVEIVLGTSFDGTVVAPTPTGSPLAPMPVQKASAASVELPADLAITNAADDLCM